MQHDDHLNRTFGALAHPVRRAVLARLAQGPASAGELGAPFALSQPAMSRHLKVLAEAGLIDRGRDAQWRPCALRQAGLADAESWLATMHLAWESRLDRLSDYIATHTKPQDKE